MNLVRSHERVISSGYLFYENGQIVLLKFSSFLEVSIAYFHIPIQWFYSIYPKLLIIHININNLHSKLLEMRSVKGKISLFQCWLPLTVMNLDGRLKFNYRNNLFH